MDGIAIEAILSGMLRGATPLIILGIGICICERSGVLNLGQEGMLSVGAVAAFIVMAETGAFWWSTLAGIAAGTVMAALFAVPTLSLKANQVASGLAVTIFGLGLAALLGASYTGTTLPEPPKMIEDTALASAMLRGFLVHGPLVYLAFALSAAALWLLRSHAGTVLDACGHDPHAASHLGINVTAVQFSAVLFGGAMAGLAGVYLALDYTPVWNEQIGGGRGWIALALAVFASRLIGRLLLGALLFGSTSVLQLAVQTTDLSLSSHLLAAMPYLITIAALILLSLRPPSNRRARTPRHLGEPT